MVCVIEANSDVTGTGVSLMALVWNCRLIMAKDSGLHLYLKLGFGCLDDHHNANRGARSPE